MVCVARGWNCVLGGRREQVHCVGAQEFSYGHIKFEFLIRHNFFFMLNSPSKLESGGGVFFFFLSQLQSIRN